MTNVRLPVLCLLLSIAAIPVIAQPPTDLAGKAFILDPGHSQNENVGIYGYSEANKVLRVGFHLKEILQQSNPDTVVMTRTDSLTSVSITQRYTYANNFPHPDKWFHSIHSDAVTLGSPANSILILISDNCWVGPPGTICQSRWGQTTISMASYQSNIMSRAYRIPTRGVYGDRTFGFQFGTSYGTSGVGVLRETLMPATLSEGGFHTNPRQNLLNMNYESKRTEAKAIWMSILGHFGVSRPPIRTLIGVISDVETNTPLKGATATIAGQTYTTNTHQNTFAPYCGTDTTCSNGFYYFENLPSGLQGITFSKPGYNDSTVQVAITDTFFTFLDIRLLSNLPPRITSSLPAQNAIGVQPDALLRLDFSRAVERMSAEANIHLMGPSGDTLNGVFTWSNADRTIFFDPDSLFAFDADYQYFIGGNVRDLYNNPFDGNGNGIGGDSLIIMFRTRPDDLTAPVVVNTFPASDDTVDTPDHVISIMFDEIVDTNSVTLTNFSVGQIGGSLLARTLQHWQAGGRSGVNIYVTAGLQSGTSYRVRVSGVADRWGNIMPAQVLWNFTVAPGSYTFTTIDDFNSSVANWWQPGASGSTVGIDSARFSISTTVAVPSIPSNTGSSLLQFYWQTGGSSWLIREYLNSGPPRSVIWQKANTWLQAYVHGDGSGTQFRFAIDDSVDAFPGGTATNHEVSLWKTIDWVGWRLAEWDLENDSVGSWLGNGRLEGDLRFDSFQLRYIPGTSAASGQVYFDQLQLARKAPSTVERDPGVLPGAFALHQNYPNPFNPETRIMYDIGEAGFVRLFVIDILGRQIRTLVAAPHQQGRYVATWDGKDENGIAVSSGVYFYRLQSEAITLSGKMNLLK